MPPLNAENRNEREVTDPITHLPLVIHDHLSVEIEQIPVHPANGEDKDSPSHHEENEEGVFKQRHVTMEEMVDHETHRPRWHSDNEGKMKIRLAIIAAGAAALGGPVGLLLLWFWSKLLGRSSFGWVELLFGTVGSLGIAVGVGACVIHFGSMEPPKDAANYSEETSEKFSRQGQDDESPESAEWLNTLLHSLWPIVNPALFASVADMLEDALQATLPKLVHGVRVSDIGQGSEPVRILGVRSLGAGAAAEEKEGMKAEEGDFTNMELVFAYRARTTKGSGLMGRSGNAHVLVEFLVAGGMLLPVWVELTGMIATARVRLQLTPNPPFLSFMTLTLLGQPKLSMICTPLAKNFLNVMDIPVLSGWLQRSVEAAVAEYVAPMSTNVDLKTLLMGREKMDTDAVGVVVVTIRSAKDFKEGDTSNIFKSKENSKGDPYVTLGWSKWGKALWSTRIIPNDGNPTWEETTTLLVGAAEMDAQDLVRLQLWDSDRMTADDLLGTVEVPLKDLMTDSKVKNRMSVREDTLCDMGGTPCIGTLLWECGYFSKTTLKQHFANRSKDTDAIESQIKAEVEDMLREAKTRDSEKGEMEQQKREDLKEKSQEIIAGSKPTEEWPSGVLAIKIEQITGLEVRKLHNSEVRESGEDEEAGDLPSAYCTVIINHQRVYKTRTKLKSNKPFFDASTEKFIRDWRHTTVILAVRDSRLHENDPLLGVVVLPLSVLFKRQSHVTDSFPLVGGIGYGRMRLSLTFRSVQLCLPPRLLGWDIGTLDIQPSLRPSLDLSADLASCRLVIRTLSSKAKVPSHQDGGWKQKHGRNIRLAVNKRYSSCLLIEFRKHAVGPDQTPAFATLWLKDIPDEEEVRLSLDVHKNTGNELARARANSSQDIGERLGKIDLTLRFWPGLSGYHQAGADKDPHMADVMEVLDCAEESKEISEDLLRDHDGTSDVSSSSSSASSSSGEDEGEAKLDEAKKGVMDGFTKYRKKEGQLHRKHRGLMQWRPARNLAWVGRGIENTAGKVGQKITGTFKHRDRDAEIEEEV
ncbi:hypothetical protein Hypma_000357 [Hypsizygus marmoreus]|uniref:Meiotically up-regulated gene 190 protein n=1 Tax=Hypsizygus marmoreus TaxID=39966 RepID=A0A369J8N5_HYPMA|nr:hypothetical protein Hypma_000357 [Hypsizygus marmoreus]